MKRCNVHRGINLLLAAMLLALGLYPVGAVSAQGARFLSAGERAAQAETSVSIRYVKPNGSTTGECQSWDTACDLQTALAAAISGDELWVAEGIYTPGWPGYRQATFQLKEGVEIYGGFAGDESALGQRSWTAHPTILSGDIDHNDVTESGVVTNTAQIKGQNVYHVVSASDITSMALLDGFTITAGNANSTTTFPENEGGGMYAANSKITIRNVTFSGNWAYSFGGGMFNNDGSSPILTDVTFAGNSGYSGGGGMYNWYSNSPSLTHVIFSGNWSSLGGGMFNNGSSPTLTHVTFSGNSANAGGGMFNDNGSSPTLTHVTFLTNVRISDNMASAGGGMYNENSSNPVLTDVTFSGNSAGSGGGMYNDSSSPSLINVKMKGNSANYGGGMYNVNNSSPTLTNVTINGNWANNYGGGMYNWLSSDPILTNAILWDNHPAENQIYNEGSTPAITYSDIQLQAGGVYPGTGNINLDPRFVDAAGGNLRLQSISPAIDAGDNAAPGLVGITTDLDGNPRFEDVTGVADTGSGSAPIVDMGAYEHPYVSVQIFLPLLAKH